MRPRSRMHAQLLALVVAMSTLTSLVGGCSVRGEDAARRINRILYVDTEGRILTVLPDGSDRRQLTPAGDVFTSAGMGVQGQLQVLSDWSLWSPDARLVAYTRQEMDGLSRLSRALYVMQADGSHPVKLFEDAQSVPFFMYWSPDSRWLAFFLSDSREQRLMVVPADGSRAASVLASGAPAYFAWSPDSRRILLHLGGSTQRNPAARLTVINLDSRQSEVIDQKPGEFGAPAWSPDGRRIAYVVHGPDDDSLWTADAQGESRQLVTTLPSGGSLSWSPDGARLGYLSGAHPDAPFGFLATYDLAARVETVLARGPLVAFFWSPDGNRIAYITADTGKSQLVWHVAEVTGGQERVISTFAPTAHLDFLLDFFDQYALSMSFWSPDSRYLVYPALGNGETLSPRGAPTFGDVVYVAPADGSAPPRAIAEGRFASWSRK